MMKRFFYMSVLVLMAALAMASCGSDDDKQKDEPYEPGGGGGSSSGSKTAVYDFTTNFSQDLLDICDVTIVYKDGDGKTVREAAKSTPFKKTVNVKKFPAVVGAKCEVNRPFDVLLLYITDFIVNKKMTSHQKNRPPCFLGISQILSLWKSTIIIN